jgi:hypothetical protein
VLIRRIARVAERRWRGAAPERPRPRPRRRGARRGGIVELAAAGRSGGDAPSGRPAAVLGRASGARLGVTAAPDDLGRRLDAPRAPAP